MVLDHKRYVEAARAEVRELEREFRRVRGKAGKHRDAARADGSDPVEQAWSHLEEQWRRLEATREAASNEARATFAYARDRFQKTLQADRHLQRIGREQMSSPRE